ncbi:MAG: transcriptional repressor [Planctomycetes bacterium]|nr:transcriptional repressor [Planctomycetota bacterium]
METQKGLETFRAALCRRHLAVTSQRMKIARAVLEAQDHFTADALLARLKADGARVGRVTVYRTLKVLLEAGLVEERAFDKGRVAYERALGRSHHDHMICVTCRRVIEFESARIEREQRRQAQACGFEVLTHQHTLFGHCRGCRAKRGNGSKA